MACMTHVRVTQETQLLPNKVVTEQQSLVVVKKLLAIAVSGITYLRGLFPEKAFGTKHVDGHKVMILKDEKTCPGACQIVQWMQGCFDAIQRRYLRTAILSIYTDPNNSQNVTECYQFQIQYRNNGAQMDIESSKKKTKVSMVLGNTKKASVLLVRKLYTVIQNLGPLPDNVYINMKLAYYNEVTPQEYQPPGFKESDGDSMEFEQEPIKLSMGKVETQYHTLKLDMATERRRLEQVTNTVEENINVEEKWVFTMENGMMCQKNMMKDAEQHEPSQDDAEIRMSCHEEIQCTQVTKMDAVMKSTSNMEVGLSRTRSGRPISTSMVSKKKKKCVSSPKKKMELEIFSSQVSPSLSAPTKKRKFSDPKEPF